MFPSWRTLVTVLALSQCAAKAKETHNLDIRTAHHSDIEVRTKVAIEALTRDYDLRPWTFTRTIVIDQNAVPHSHPTLTIHTRHLEDRDALLSTYLHEELHWFLEQHKAQTEAAERDLIKMYPSVPVGYPDGANDVESTYLHLIDCDLEFHADESLLGPERARRVMEFWATDHYRWVYKKILSDRSKIDAVLRSHSLNQPEAAARSF